MKKTQIKRDNVYRLLTAICITALISACSGGGGATATAPVATPPVAAPVAASYSGPGSKWNFNLSSDSTFNIERSAGVNAPVDMTISGNYSRLDSGFMKLTIVSSTGANAPAAAETAWALEIPGYALLVEPMQTGSDQIIAMVAAGACPTSNLNANWVLVKQDVGRDTSDPLADYTGSFSYDVVTGAPVLPARYSLTDPLVNLGAFTLASGNCSDGILSFPQATLYMTDNGGAIVHTFGDDLTTEDDDNFIFALEQKAITNVSAMDGDFVGMLFDEAGTAGNKVVPVSLSCVSGTCTGYNVIDVDTGAVDISSSVTVLLSGTVDTPETGIITGTISTDTSVGNLTCMIDIDASGTGKKIGSCVGQAPDDATKMFNVMFVSKN